MGHPMETNYSFFKKNPITRKVCDVLVENSYVFFFIYNYNYHSKTMGHPMEKKYSQFVQQIV